MNHDLLPVVSATSSSSVCFPTRSATGFWKLTKHLFVTVKDCALGNSVGIASWKIHRQTGMRAAAM